METAKNRFRIYINGCPMPDSPGENRARTASVVDIDGLSSSSDDGSFCRTSSIRRQEEEEEEEEEDVEEEEEEEEDARAPLINDHRRGSPSHRSQDSGFSDSGESNCGQSLPPNPGSSSSTISSGINNSAGIAVGRNATTTTTTPMSLSGPTSLGSAFRRKASRVFYASEEKLDEQDWPRPGANVWYSSTCSRVEFNEARLCSTADAVRHPPVVRFGKTKSVPSLEDSSTSGTSSSGPSSQFTLSNIRRTLFGSKSSHDLNNTGSPKPATLPSSCKTASPVQKGILKKQQRDDNFRRSSPSTCRSPASFTCWSTAVLAKEVPNWRVGVGDDPFAGPRSLVTTFSSSSSTSSSSSSSWDDNGKVNVHPEFSAATLPRPGHRKKPHFSFLGEHPALTNSGSSVKWWWTDLRRNGGEMECANVLQGKSLLSDKRMAPAINAGRAATAIKTIQCRAHVISGDFVKLCQQLENHMFHRIPPISQSLVVSIEEFLAECKQLDIPGSPLCDSNRKHDSGNPSSPSSSMLSGCSSSSSSSASSSGSLRRRLRSQESTVRRICAQLRKTSGVSPQADDFRGIVQMVASLGHAFTRLVNILLTGQIEKLLVCLEMASEGFLAVTSASTSMSSAGRQQVSTEPSELGATLALKSLIAVGLGGYGNGGVGGLSALVAAAGGIRTLLSLCLLPAPPAPRALALRALAALCCVPQAIRQLDEAGGIEVLADILCDIGDDPTTSRTNCIRGDERLQQERTEAAGVLAQVTSPWIEENHHLGGLQDHLRRIVVALTELCKNGGDEERFLLASASLANLSFLAPEAIDIMRDISAAQVLIAAATNYQIVVFAKDQIATVLANMAASPICRTTVASDDGLRVLHDFLLSSPRPDQRPAEISACERVQQKSAIALSRLCSETDVAKKVVHMGVVARLVQLCRDERERNQSDAVLIGCLAALRKLVTACGMDPLKSCNASDLVEPRLLDSFLLCSSQQESYV